MALPINAWWTAASTAFSDLKAADRFGINTIIVEDDTQWDWSVVIDALATYDFSDRFRRSGQKRAREFIRDLTREVA